MILLVCKAANQRYESQTKIELSNSCALNFNLYRRMCASICQPDSMSLQNKNTITRLSKCISQLHHSAQCNTSGGRCSYADSIGAEFCACYGIQNFWVFFPASTRCSQFSWKNPRIECDKLQPCSGIVMFFSSPMSPQLTNAGRFGLQPYMASQKDS